MQRHRLAALLGAALLVTTYSYATPDDPSFLGTYELTGTYSNQRQTKVLKLNVERAADGTFTVTRTAKYTSRRYRNRPEFTWVGTGRLEGGALKVTYRTNPDGTPVTGNGMTSVITNPNAPGTTTAPSPPATAGQGNVYEATYTLTEEGRVISEALTNTTRKAPEDWWTGIRSSGPRLTSPEPTTAATGRVKLGGDLEVKANGRYTVIVPTDGTLKLKVTSGTITLQRPDGTPVDRPAAAELTWDIPHRAPVLGAYTVVVSANAQAGAKLSAAFTQDGRIDARIRPWSSHTYYPIYDGGETMFKADGPLEKFDKALGLTGRDSALWWEKGTDYRTSFGFERGHYTRTSSPTERNAERDWHADFDGDGTIQTEDGAAAFARYDANHDGKVTSDEARELLIQGQIKTLWSSYDKNGDGKVTATEINQAFVTQHDKNADGGVDPQEWDRALRAQFAQLLRDRTNAGHAALMAKDKNGDAALDATELGTPGGVDFQDSSDVDNDFKSFFDQDNIAIVQTGTNAARHFGNRVTTEGGRTKLYKGRKSDELVVELEPAQVGSQQNGVADGDLDDSYSVGWWGHCNAWSMASIVFRKPEGDLSVNGVTLNVRDQKGILVEMGMGDTEDSAFYWQQFGGDDIPADRYAAGFHRQLHRWLRVEQQGMMADMDMKDPHNQLNFAVWNYPLLGYVAEMKEAAGDDPYVLDVSCTLEKGSYSDEDSSSTARVTYTLHFDASGAITEGASSKTAWTQKSGDKLVFIRYLIHPYRFTGRGSSGNPNVTLERLQRLFGDRLKYNRIEELATNGTGLPTPPGQ
jgi:hypothetical protein